MDYMMELALNEQTEQYEEFLQMKADEQQQEWEFMQMVEYYKNEMEVI